MSDDERAARAALTRVGEPGDEVVNRWLDRHGAVETLGALGADTPLPGATAARWSGLRTRAQGIRAGSDLVSIGELGGRFLCPGDREWPSQLDDLGGRRPIGLWVRGRASLRFWALRSVAVVGARACTDYGAHVASVLGSDLASRGWTVVSGAAYGVDSAAHRGALSADGATVGVLACGADVAYPPGNGELIDRIGERGLLVTELPPGDHPTRHRFVLRNRVIAALTRGTVVVEAQLRSGSLITARRALALGRSVMGVPGPVTSALSTGVHQLLREGGAVVTDAAEVVEMVGAIGELAPERRAPAVPRDLLAPEAAHLLEALPARGALRTAAVAHAAALAHDRALARLRELHALGFVERNGDYWQLVRGGKQHSNR